MDDDDDYGFEYEDETPSEPDVDLENQYYTAKGLKTDGNFEEALENFQKVLELEDEKGEWGFKALKQMIKLSFAKGDFDSVVRYYKQLLTYIKSAVTKNYSEKSINSILDHISTSKDPKRLSAFYTTTLEALKDSKNERLWFKTNTKLGKLYFELRDFDALQKIITQLRASCQTDDGEDVQNKGTQLLEVCALEIQMYTEQKNNKALKALYEQSLHVKSAIPHPLIMGTIRECGGKMHLREGQFEKAHTDFFEAFKNYDESGSPRRTACLKYVVLANMLIKSDINPFDSQEAKPYKNEPDIIAMTSMVAAYQKKDIEAFEEICRENHDSIMADPFIKEHIQELVNNVRTQALLRLIKPYRQVRLSYLAEKLRISLEDAKRLLIDTILEEDLSARIDEINDVLVLNPAAALDSASPYNWEYLRSAADNLQRLTVTANNYGK